MVSTADKEGEDGRIEYKEGEVGPSENSALVKLQSITFSLLYEAQL